MSLIRNVKVEKLACPAHVTRGDSFRLSITQDGVRREVHREEITTCKTITHWAVFQIGESGLAYAIGDHRLADDLNQLARAA